MFEIKLGLLIVPAAFFVANTMLAISAWMGDEWAIVLMAVFGVILSIFYAASSTLNQNTLELVKEVVDDLRTEADYSRELSEDHADALRLLAQHDPATAAVLLARYKNRITERWPEEMSNVVPLRLVDEN